MLTDVHPMPFGKHAGTKMENVPASYLHYLWTKADFSKFDLTKEPDKQHQKNSFFVAKYISERLSALKEENEDLIW